MCDSGEATHTYSQSRPGPRYPRFASKAELPEVITTNTPTRPTLPTTYHHVCLRSVFTAAPASHRRINSPKTSGPIKAQPAQCVVCAVSAPASSRHGDA